MQRDRHERKEMMENDEKENDKKKEEPEKEKDEDRKPETDTKKENKNGCYSRKEAHDYSYVLSL